MLLKFWTFIDGYYLSQGIDILKTIEGLPAHRAMNVIDSIVVEDALRNANSEERLEKARTNVLKVYNRTEGYSNDEYGGRPRESQPGTKTEQTEDGYVGLEPPVGGTWDDDDGASPFG